MPRVISTTEATPRLSGAGTYPLTTLFPGTSVFPGKAVATAVEVRSHWAWSPPALPGAELLPGFLAGTPEDIRTIGWTAA